MDIWVHQIGSILIFYHYKNNTAFSFQFMTEFTTKKKKELKKNNNNTAGLPCGTVVGSPPTSSGDMGLIPGLGESHMPQGN